MVRINNINPIVNLFVSKTGNKYITKPETISIFESNITKLKPALDTFKRNSIILTVNDVKRFFPNNQIGGGNFRKEMYKVKTSLFLEGLLSKKAFKKWQHSVDLSNPLKDSDYRDITELINSHNGNFINIWLDQKDGIRNIEKIALFIRSLKHLEKTEFHNTSKTNKLNFFKNMSKDEWATCIDGIINRPNEVIPALMQYKYNSTKINQAISFKDGTPKIINYIKQIEKFLEKQSTKTSLKTYRGEGNFWVFNKVKLDNGKTLKEMLDEMTIKIENNSLKEKDIENFINKFMIKKIVPQERFMSTAMLPEDTQKYAQKVLWHLDVPKGTKASFIESYNVERNSETELLIQKDSNMFIKKAEYDKKNHRWNIWATIMQ